MTWSLAPSGGRLSIFSTRCSSENEQEIQERCQIAKTVKMSPGRKQTDGVLSSRKSGEEYGLVCSFDQESTKKNLFR